MDNSIISEIHTKAYKDGIKEGMEIARQMLCKSLGKDIDSYGKALAHVDVMIIEMERNKREQTAIDE